MQTRHAVIIVAAILTGGTAVSAHAQEGSVHVPRWEFIVSSGKVLPTGEQRSQLERGNVSVAQLSRTVSRAVVITSSIGWARTRNIAVAGDPKLDVFTYDVGGEFRADALLPGFTSFVGAGAGGRSYNYRSRDVDATHNLAAYGAAGAELDIGARLRLRVEARNYVTGFKPLEAAGAADTRNDVSILAGLRVKVR
jgi:hypothetical protein